LTTFLDSCKTAIGYEKGARDLQIEAWCIKVRFLYFCEDPLGAESFQDESHFYVDPNSITEEHSRLSLDKVVRREDEMFARLQTERWDWVFVGCGRDTGDSLLVIVLDWTGKIAERIGMIDLGQGRAFVEEFEDLLKRYGRATKRTIQLS